MTYVAAARGPRNSLDLERLANILERCGSDHDGERSAAALIATKLIRSHNLRWHDVIAPKPQGDAQPRGDATISELRHWLLASDRLSTRERIFVRTLRDHRRLTAKQQAWLDAIIAKVAA